MEGKETPIERALRKIAKFQVKNSEKLVIIAVAFSIALGIGMIHLTFNTNITKEMPQNMKAINLQNEVNSNFKGGSVLFIIVSLKKGCYSENMPQDMRDWKVISSMLFLQKELEKEPNVEKVVSPATIFENMGNIPKNDTIIKKIIENSQMSDFFSKDYSSALMIVDVNAGSGEKDVERLTNNIKKDIDHTEKPPCVEYQLTGDAPIRVVLLNLLIGDMKRTFLIAAIIIFILLVVLRKSIIQSILIMAPLLMGMAWTMGTLGWMNVHLSIAVAGIGAMLLGLGVEYGVFVLERYLEEREKGKTIEEAITTSVPSVCSSIFGSGTTTIVSFLALATVAFPMIRNLGLTLGFGIFCMLFSAVFIEPCLIIVKDKHGGVK